MRLKTAVTPKLFLSVLISLSFLSESEARRASENPDILSERIVSSFKISPFCMMAFSTSMISRICCRNQGSKLVIKFISSLDRP